MDLTSNELVLSFQAPRVCAKFGQNRIKIATDRAGTDRHTHIHTHTDRDDTGDLIICPMLCYSNGTDNNNTKMSWGIICLFALYGYTIGHPVNHRTTMNGSVLRVELSIHN